MSEKDTYNLYSIERRYKDETFISYYFQKNKNAVKKRGPIDIEGERFCCDFETGEITNYTRKQVMESYSASLRRTVILMNTLLAMNDFDWFWTLTFDKDKIDRTDDKVVFDCYKKYINNLKHKYPNFKYMCFPERHHDEDNCIHFHLLTGGITAKQMGLVNSGKVCCHWAEKHGKKTDVCSKEFFEKTKHLYELKDTDGEPIYNITTFAYGYTTVSRICSRERCNSYVKKYVEKALGSTEIFKKRFYYSKNLNVPEVIKKLIGSEFDTPCEINKVNKLNRNYIRAAKGDPNITPYNVMQIKIDNIFKDLIDSGMTILNEFYCKQLEDIFNG